MNFASDNRGPAHPRVLDALVQAGAGYSPSYGAEAGMEAVRDRIREIFEAPRAEVFLTATGTATNALILSCLARPFDEIYCAYHSHIRVDECNAVEFFTGGARISAVGHGDRLEAGALRRRLAEAAPHGIHNAQPGPVSLVQVADMGGVYKPEEIAGICDVARDFGLAVHMDGARFANAVAALGCSPAEASWKAGVDALSFGGTKNGCLGVEAAIFFNPGHAREFELRRKRAGHLLSKHRFLSAQMAAYLEGDSWLDTARAANRAGQRLFEGLRGMPGTRFLVPAQANLGFVELPRATHRRAVAAGAVYEIMGDLDGPEGDEPLACRLVCDWSVRDEDADRFLELVAPR